MCRRGRRPRNYFLLLCLKEKESYGKVSRKSRGKVIEKEIDKESRLLIMSHCICEPMRKCWTCLPFDLQSFIEMQPMQADSFVIKCVIKILMSLVNVIGCGMVRRHFAAS